ncbi:MAG: chloride channel protein [Eubacterium sp.]|nr:chloride channel protein [Eubacterium sp.]
MKEKLKKWYQEQEFATLPDIKLTFAHARVGLRWMVLSVIIGLAVGAFSSVFAWCLQTVTAYRQANPWLLYLLPVGGLIIVALYRACGAVSDKGTNVLLHAVQENYCNVPALMAPLIFAATLITHLFGGSAGREGAALQMGGSLGNSIGRLFRQKKYNRKILVMSGMSAAFSAVFGTPLAAAVFPMEMVNIGIMQYSALVPCVFASIVANQFAVNMGINPEAFVVRNIPPVAPLTLLKILLLGLLCAWVSIFFCRALRTVGSLYALLLKNPYLKAVAGGLMIIGLTLLVGNNYYNGAGTGLIEMAIEGDVPAFSFLLKVLFTALTLGAGYKGGEIVPAFCTGATFGCVFGHLMGISPSLCAAAGMIAVFCGVTNCPVTSMLIGFELFGFAGVKYLLLAISISYLFSGYRGLYSDQVIMQSKYHVKYIHDFDNDSSEGPDAG